MKFDIKKFQTIKISNDLSNFKIIPDIINFIKKFNEELDLKIDEDIIVSIKYGKRLVINCEKSNLKKIHIEDFIEIADYNPIKKLFLFIGRKNPDFNMTFHWIIQNARRNNNVLVQLQSNFLTEKIENKFNDNNIIDEPIEIAKDILFKLRDNDFIYSKKYGFFVIGNSLNDIQNILEKIIEGNK